MKLRLETLTKVAASARAAGESTVVVPLADFEALLAAVARDFEPTEGMVQPHKSEIATWVDEAFGTGDPSADGAGCGAKNGTSSRGVQGGLDADDLLNGVDL